MIADAHADIAFCLPYHYAHEEYAVSFYVFDT